MDGAAKDSGAADLYPPVWRRRQPATPPPPGPPTDGAAVERLDDRALVRRMKAGDEAAFEEFFSAHVHPLYRFVLARVGHDPELARELTQAGICTGIEKLHTYRGEAPLYSWLCSVCRYEVTNHFRRQNRRPPEVELPEDHPAVRGVLESLRLELRDPEDQALRREVARLVHVTADHLPPRYRTVLEQKYVEGLPVKEIAAGLGISPKAAESLLTRAREAFKDAFSALYEGAPPRAGVGAGGAGR